MDPTRMTLAGVLNGVSLRGVPDQYKQEFLAYYYNHAQATGREVAVTYKDFDLAPGSGVVDLELGRMHHLTYNEWITDTTIDDGSGWGYLKDAAYKSPTTLVHLVRDRTADFHFICPTAKRDNDERKRVAHAMRAASVASQNTWGGGRHAGYYDGRLEQLYAACEPHVARALAAAADGGINALEVVVMARSDIDARHQQEQQVRADQSGIDSADAGEQVVLVDPDRGDVEERGEVGEVAGPLLEQGG